MSLSSEQVVPLQVKSPKSAEANSLTAIVEPSSDTLTESAPSSTEPPEPIVIASLM